MQTKYIMGEQLCILQLSYGTEAAQNVVKAFVKSCYFGCTYKKIFAMENDAKTKFSSFGVFEL